MQGSLFLTVCPYDPTLAPWLSGVLHVRLIGSPVEVHPPPLTVQSLSDFMTLFFHGPSPSLLFSPLNLGSS